MELDIVVSAAGGHPLIGLRGEIDLATLPRLHDALIKAMAETAGSTIIVDLDGVHACDDAGLGVLLGAAGRARADNGDLVAVCSDPTLRERLERTGFARAVRVTSTIAEAIAR